jgi:hypothetical protein
VAVRTRAAARACAAARSPTGAGLLLSSQRSNGLRWNLLICNRDAPTLLQASATLVKRLVGIAARLVFLLYGIAACLNRFLDIELLLLADDDVVAARVNRVTGLDDHLTVAIAAHDF